MIPLLRSELLKLRTTRTMLGLVIGMTALIVLITALNGWVADAASLARRKDQFQLLANGSIAGAFAGILGLMSMSAEFRHGTIHSTLLATPRRVRVLGAKIAACALLGIVLGAFGIAVSYGLGKIALSTRNIPSALSGRDYVLLIGGAILSAALWGAFGAALGAAIRNQVVAIVAVLVWVLFVENILFALVPSVGRYLPASASNALTQIETAHQLSVTQGTLLFVVYICVATLIAAAITTRRDIP